MQVSSAAIAANGVDFVFFDAAEKKEIKDTLQVQSSTVLLLLFVTIARVQIFGMFFTAEEMRRFYARFKENGKVCCNR